MTSPVGGTPAMGALPYEILCTALTELTCNCPWEKFYKATVWPEGYPPPPEAIALD